MSDFLLAMVMQQFLKKIVTLPARGENRICSHPRTGSVQSRLHLCVIDAVNYTLM